MLQRRSDANKLQEGCAGFAAKERGFMSPENLEASGPPLY